MSKTITQEDAIKLLQEIVKKNGSQFRAAISLDISPAYLGEILKGTRPISDGIAHKLGYKRVIVFKKVEAQEGE
jgi:hypothetical protein